MTDAEKAAVEWLERIASDRQQPCSPTFRMECARTIKAMLAEPRMLPWRETLPLSDLQAAVESIGCVLSVNTIAAVLDAYHAHLAAPKTKTVEVWHVEHCVEGVPTVTVRLTKENADCSARNAASVGDTCIRVTGPHKQEAPA